MVKETAWELLTTCLDIAPRGRFPYPKRLWQSSEKAPEAPEHALNERAGEDALGHFTAQPSRVGGGSIARRLAKFNAPRQKSLPEVDTTAPRRHDTAMHRLGRVRVHLPPPTVTQMHHIGDSSLWEGKAPSRIAPVPSLVPRVSAVWPQCVRVLHHSFTQGIHVNARTHEVEDEDDDLFLNDLRTDSRVRYAVFREEDVLAWAGVARKLPIGSGDGRDDDESTSPEDLYKGCLHYAGVMEAAVSLASKEIAAAMAEAFPQPDDWDA